MGSLVLDPVRATIGCHCAQAQATDCCSKRSSRKTRILSSSDASCCKGQAPGFCPQRSWSIDVCWLIGKLMASAASLPLGLRTLCMMAPHLPGRDANKIRGLTLAFSSTPYAVRSHVCWPRWAVRYFPQHSRFHQQRITATGSWS